MVLFLITLLAVSIIGMLALLWAKHYELSTGHLLFANSRPGLSKFLSRTVFLFGTAIPLYVRWQLHRVYRTFLALVHWLAAHGILKFEAWLEGMLNSVREKTSTTREPGEASAFLREVGEYKKKLKK